MNHSNIDGRLSYDLFLSLPLRGTFFSLLNNPDNESYFHRVFLHPKVITRARAPSGQYRGQQRQRAVSLPPQPQQELVSLPRPPQRELVSCLAPPPQGAGGRRPPDALLGKDLQVQYHLFMISRFLVLCRLPPDALFGKGLQVQYL